MSTTWSALGPRSARATCTTLSESAPSAPAKATGTVAFATAVAGNTVTINGLLFTALALGSTATGADFAVGASDTATGANFAAAVNRNASICGVTGVNAIGTVTLTANEYGVAGNGITLTKVGTPITVSGAVLSGGVDPAGMNLQDVGSFAVYGSADSGATLASAVTVTAYVLNPYTLRWTTAPTWNLTGSATGVRDEYLGGYQVLSPVGRVVLIPTAGSVSAGGFTVDIVCTDSNGQLI